MTALKRAKYTFLFLTYLFSSFAFSNQQTFFIAPYLLKKAHNQTQLRFQIEGNASFINSLDNEEVKATEKVLTSIPLQKQSCDEPQKMNLLNTGKESLFEVDLPPYSCDPEIPIQFAFISDTQKYPNAHNKMAQLLFNRVQNDPISFIVNGGDIVQDGSVESKWQNFLKASIPYSQSIPIVPVLGNHDYWGHSGEEKVPLFFKKYLMTEDDQSDGYYTLDYPQFKLVVLNSNFPKLGEEKIGLQKAWLEKELEKSKKKDQIVIIAFHHSPITSNFFYYGPVSVAMRKSWIPLFEKSGVVKLVLNGHSHLYERSLKNGIMYVVAGPFGGQKNNFPKLKNYHRLSIHPNTHTYSLFYVSKKNIAMETFDENDKLIDLFQINPNFF